MPKICILNYCKFHLKYLQMCENSPWIFYGINNLILYCVNKTCQRWSRSCTRTLRLTLRQAWCAWSWSTCTLSTNCLVTVPIYSAQQSADQSPILDIGGLTFLQIIRREHLGLGHCIIRTMLSHYSPLLHNNMTANTGPLNGLLINSCSYIIHHHRTPASGVTPALPGSEGGA